MLSGIGLFEIPSPEYFRFGTACSPGLDPFRETWFCKTDDCRLFGERRLHPRQRTPKAIKPPGRLNFIHGLQVPTAVGNLSLRNLTDLQIVDPDLASGLENHAAVHLS